MTPPDSTPRSIATRTGDDGTTALLYGRRVSKSDPRVEAYGTVDELGAALGLARTQTADTALGETVRTVQAHLLILGTELAVDASDRERFAKSKLEKLGEEHLRFLDTQVAEQEKAGPGFTGFTLPGSDLLEAAFHLARTVCRRAERQVHRAEEATGEPIRPLLKQYLNRLSDLLWLLAQAHAK